MTLLFITRKIDCHDSRAGFVSEWAAEFAQHLDKLIIICQEKGDCAGLPENIEIYSLGKEKGSSRIKQYLLLNCYIVKLLNKSNGVFAHMMPIYSIIAGPWCKVFGKKLIQWYTHKSVDWRLKWANFWVDAFVTASRESFRLETKKPVHIFGHGINVNRFVPRYKIQDTRYKIQTKPKSQIPKYFKIITVGRISPSKDYESMIKAVYELREEGIGNIKLIIVGGVGLPEQENYLNTLKEMVKNMKIEPQVEFIGPVPPTDTLKYFQDADLFINLSDTGSLDKTVLEAMAVGAVVITSNEAFQPILPAELMVAKDRPDILAKKIKEIMDWPEDKKEELRKKLRQEVVERHNLDRLVEKIISLY